ncbi:activator-dependent family glycosyltransferase [Streptomyces capitiformicae]|uniref:activator-dependent family glycosyltransferase n=1 Tax=Streptomyces capitiformicae TaxID=2014920 RepID=UPI001674D7F5|nr:activator-dependent family glycosyltransferase [Streptomyces capitiformicae]
MRVLFVTLAVKTHFFVQAPLAWALRAAGHEVCVASQPDLVDDIAATGLTAVPVGPPLAAEAGMEVARQQYEAAAARLADPPNPQDLMRFQELRPEKLTYDFTHGVFTVMTSTVFQNFSAERTIDDLVDLGRRWQPDLVIWDTVMMGAAVAAQACGAAHARLLYGLDLVGRMRESYLAEVDRRDPELREDPLAEWLTRASAGYGGEFSEELVVGQWTIDPTPSSMRLAVDHPYVPVRHIPYNGPSVVPDWLREPPKRRRVCLTLGLSFRDVQGGGQASASTLLEALAELDAEVVATLSPEQLAAVGTLPDNVRAVDFVPLNELLPSCSAIVHHGGYGTWQNALVHGVPQVLVASDVWDGVPRAELIDEAGAGLTLPADAAPEKIRDAVARVLDDSAYAEKAAALGAEIRATPAPTDLIPELERLTAAHRRPA